MPMSYRIPLTRSRLNSLRKLCKKKSSKQNIETEQVYFHDIRMLFNPYGDMMVFKRLIYNLIFNLDQIMS